MISYISHVMTLANSIIGVSVLAMPFCFKQCGIILAIVVLTLCSLLSRLACHFLIKSAVMSRRRNYEFLAFHAFGLMGKFLVELFVIGFLLGTCIAFFVVIGDLGPQIIGKMLYKNPEDIRMSFLITTAALIVLPLGLLRNIDSLANISTVTIGFYLCLVLKIITDAMEHIFRWDWYDNVNYWRPAGILQCLPIFSMALFCQTQLFEIYESIPNVTLEKMNIVVKGAINICTLVYISVGVFGYVGFCMQPFSGNILLSFQPSMTSDIMKIGFVLSVVFSFPLVIFPCRASLNSLLFRRAYMHESSSNYIPEIRFRCLTLIIVTVSLITGLLMPNIEFVLGFVGSTIGVMICLIFPAGFFITISTKNTNERLMAQVILFIGMWIMILGSYANLYAVEESSIAKIAIDTEKPFLQLNLLHERPLIPQVIDIIPKDAGKEHLSREKDSIKSQAIPVDTWREPASAVEQPIITEKIPNISPQSIDLKVKNELIKTNDNIHVESNVKPMNEVILTAEEKIKAIEEKEKIVDTQASEHQINSDAIKKEESEIAAAADQNVDVGAAELLKEQLRIKDTLAQHKIETIELLKEQKAILQDMKKLQKEELEKEQKNLKNAAAPVELVVNKNDNKIIVEEVKEPNSIAILPENTQNQQSQRELSDSKVHIDNKKFVVEEKINEFSSVQNKVADSPKVHAQNDEKLKNIAVANGPSIESRGPILNALTNRTIARNISNSLSTNEVMEKKINSNISRDTQYALPIALKLINHTEVIQPKNSNESDEKVSLIHRDILEEHKREKRDADENSTLINETQDNESSVVNNIIDIDQERKCTSNQSSAVSDGEKNKIQSTTELIIKTNVYLADQKFDQTIALKAGNMANVEYQIVKKRDLKALKPDKSRE